MFKKTTLLICVLAMTVGCIETDKFTPDGTTVKKTSVWVKAPILPSDDTQLNTYWKNGDAIDFYYTALNKWNRLVIDGVSRQEDVDGSFTSDLEWKNNVRSHVFYALRPATQLGAIADNSDPSALGLNLSGVQLHSDGVDKYMISCGTALVRGDEDVRMELEPSLPVVKLNVTVENNITVKRIKLTAVGAGEGKGISGAYKMDITDNSVNMRETKDNSVTIDFGDKGIDMQVDKQYVVYAVMLPAKLNGLKFSVSGSTTVSSLQISAFDAMDLKAGQVQDIDLHLIPGPIRQDYKFEASCGSLGSSTATSAAMLGFQGGKKDANSAVKGLEISKSEIEFEYIGGRTEMVDAHWAITCSDWIVPSQTSGKGAASIALSMQPNTKPIGSAGNTVMKNLSEQGSANTYIVNKPGTYRFDANVMGNGDSGIINGANFVDHSGRSISSATIQGGTSAGVVWQYYAGMITDVKLQGNQIEFTTSSTLYAGNALIALYDASGQILWSWQIWSTEELGEDDEVINANTNENSVGTGKNKFLMMDRNLGALAKLHTDLSSHPKAREGEITVIQYTDETLTIPTGESFTHKVYQIGSGSDSYYQALYVGNILYQWGRKDPIMIPYTASTRPGLIRFDGENNEIAPIILDDGGKDKGYGVTIQKSIKTPDVYYKSNGTTNWLDTNNDYLWGNRNGNVVSPTDGSRPVGTKTIYDPCPKGYMLPTIDVWTAFSTSLTNGSWAPRGGYTFKSNGGSQAMFYSGSGSINSTGVLTSYGADTYYWSNTSTGGSNNTHQLYIKNGAVNNNINIGRGNGNHVRCMKQK